MYSSFLRAALIGVVALLAIPASAAPVLESRAIVTFTGRIIVRNAANATTYGYFAKTRNASDDATNSTPTALYYVTKNVSQAATFTFDAASSGTTSNITVTYLTGLASVPRRTVVSSTLIAQSVLPSEAYKRPNYQPNAFSYTPANKTLSVYFNQAAGPKPLVSFLYPPGGFVLRPTGPPDERDGYIKVVNILETTT